MAKRPIKIKERKVNGRASALSCPPNDKPSCTWQSRERGRRRRQRDPKLHISMLQADELPDNIAYLDGSLAVMAFKSKKHLKNIHMVKHRVKINCNPGMMNTNQQGDYGGVTAWYIPDWIANILSMTKLEKKSRITYDSWDGYYTVHTQIAID